MEASCSDKTNENDVEIDTLEPCQRRGIFDWELRGRINVTKSWKSYSILRFSHSKAIEVHRTLKSAISNNKIHSDLILKKQ